MTVHITDYTPDGKRLEDCLYTEILETVRAIHRHGMLRMHASNRMFSEVDGELRHRGCGLYEHFGDITPWEKEVGLDWSIARGGQVTKDTDCHEALLCDLDGVVETFAVGGPLTEEWKARVSEVMRTKVAQANARRAERAAEEAKKPKNPNAPICITGSWNPHIQSSIL